MLVEQLAVALADARLAEQGFLQVVVVQPALQPVGLCALDALVAAWLGLAERRESVQLQVALRLLARSHVVCGGVAFDAGAAGWSRCTGLSRVSDFPRCSVGFAVDAGGAAGAELGAG